MTEHCSEANDDCLAIRIYDCSGSISNETCQHANATGDTHIASRITMTIVFWHNFTDLLNCSVFFVHSYGNNLNRMSVLRTEIRFLQPNESLHRRDMVSGNIGYIRGEPVIISRLVSKSSNNSDASDDRIISYFDNRDVSEDIIRLPKLKWNRHCTLTNLEYETIRFGENIFVKCDAGIAEAKYKQFAALPLTEKNFTEICQQFQRNIFHFLLHSVRQAENETTYISHIETMLSVYGNPRNMSADWVRMELTEQSADVIGMHNQIVGIFDKDEDENEFTCTNMILNARYEFFYGQFRVSDVKNQMLLKRSFIELGNRINLRFQLDEEIRVPIYLDVVFFDLTSSGFRAKTFSWWMCAFFVVCGIA